MKKRNILKLLLPLFLIISLIPVNQQKAAAYTSADEINYPTTTDIDGEEIDPLIYLQICKSTYDYWVGYAEEYTYSPRYHYYFYFSNEPFYLSNHDTLEDGIFQSVLLNQDGKKQKVVVVDFYTDSNFNIGKGSYGGKKYSATVSGSYIQLSVKSSLINYVNSNHDIKYLDTDEVVFRKADESGQTQTPNQYYVYFDTQSRIAKVGNTITYNFNNSFNQAIIRIPSILLQSGKTRSIKFYGQLGFLTEDIQNVNIRMISKDLGKNTGLLKVNYTYSEFHELYIVDDFECLEDYYWFEIVVTLNKPYNQYFHGIETYKISTSSAVLTPDPGEGDGNFEGNNTVVINNIFDAIINLPSLVGNALSDFFTNLGNGINKVWQGILNLPEQIGNSLSGFFDFIGSGIENVFQGILNLPGQIGEALGGFFNNVGNAIGNIAGAIIDGFKSLFIPDQEFFSTYFDELHDFFSEKLGILIYPFEFMYNLVNRFLTMEPGTGMIHIPAFNFMDVDIIPQIDFNLKENFQAILGNYYAIYYKFVDFIIYIMLIAYARKMFDEIVGGHHDS